MAGFVRIFRQLLQYLTIEGQAHEHAKTTMEPVADFNSKPTWHIISSRVTGRVRAMLVISCKAPRQSADDGRAHPPNRRPMASTPSNCQANTNKMAAWLQALHLDAL